MTNVPNEIRTIWTDLYILFDSHYLLENTSEGWQHFWNDAQVLYEKHGSKQFVYDAIQLICHVIESRFKGVDP